MPEYPKVCTVLSYTMRYGKNEAYIGSLVIGAPPITTSSKKSKRIYTTATIAMAITINCGAFLRISQDFEWRPRGIAF